MENLFERERKRERKVCLLLLGLIIMSLMVIMLLFSHDITFIYHIQHIVEHANITKTYSMTYNSSRSPSKSPTKSPSNSISENIANRGNNNLSLNMCFTTPYRNINLAKVSNYFNVNIENVNAVLSILDNYSQGYWQRFDINNLTNKEKNPFVRSEIINIKKNVIKKANKNIYNGNYYMKWYYNNSNNNNNNNDNSATIKESIIDCLWNKKVLTWGDSTTGGITQLFVSTLIPTYNKIYENIENIDLIQWDQTKFYYKFNTINQKYHGIKLHGKSNIDSNKKFDLIYFPLIPSHHFGLLLWNIDKLQIMVDYVYYNTSIKCNKLSDFLKEIFCGNKNMTKLLNEVKSYYINYILDCDYIILNTLLHDNLFWMIEIHKIFINEYDINILENKYNINKEIIYPQEILNVIDWIRSINKNIKIIYWSGIALYQEDKLHNNPGMPYNWFSFNKWFLQNILTSDKRDIYNITYVDSRYFFKNQNDRNDIHYSNPDKDPTFPWIGIQVIKSIFDEICRS